MITVYQAKSSFDAKLIQDQLAFADIESHIMGDLLQGGAGELQVEGLVKLMIDESDLEKSIKVIDHWEKTKVSDHETPVSQTTKSSINTKPLLLLIIVFVIMGFYFIAEY